MPKSTKRTAPKPSRGPLKAPPPKPQGEYDKMISEMMAGKARSYTANAALGMMENAGNSLKRSATSMARRAISSKPSKASPKFAGRIVRTKS